MDGNGRWAKARGVPRLMGHRAGRESVREAVKGCVALGVDVRAALRAHEGRPLRPDQVDETLIGRSLYTAGLPDPDLLIRTSGEMRLSNFMLWQLAYTELWVTDTLWPDFRRRHLYQAVADYQRRDRRFGRVD